VRCPIGLYRMDLASFSRPHSDLHCAPQYPAVASAVIRRCYNGNKCLSDTQNREVPACTCQNGAGRLIARSPANSLHDMRICALETHSCPTDSTSRPGLWHELRATSIFTICPRPAICRRCVCCFSSAQQSILDLIRDFLAPPAYRGSRAYVCHRAQRTPTWCSAHGE
jgi:hypothetical protein